MTSTTTHQGLGFELNQDRIAQQTLLAFDHAAMPVQVSLVQVSL
jgi:hypothetical protein